VGTVDSVATLAGPDTVYISSNQVGVFFYQSWASASRQMPPASAFRHLDLVPEYSSTGLGPLYSGTGLLPESAFLIHSGTGMTGCRAVRRSGIQKHCTEYEGEKGYTLYICTTGDEEGYTLHVHTLPTEKIDTPSSGLHFHTAYGGKENTSTSTLLTVDRPDEI
jgi:hypothetical protein